MRVFHVQGDQFTELSTLPEAAPEVGYLWVGIARAEFDAQNGSVLEVLTGFKRAGADAILTYFALDAAAWLAERN